MILIKYVWFDEDSIVVEMNSGQTISKPVNSYPNLKRGTKSQLSNYKIEGNGRWIHWQDLDEDLSAEGFLEHQNQY